MSMDVLDHLRRIETGGTQVCLVSKYWDVDRIHQLHAEGFRRFAESRADALAQRADASL